MMSRKKREKWKSGNEAKDFIGRHLRRQGDDKRIFQIDNRVCIRYPNRAWTFKNR